MDTSYQRKELGISHAYVAEASQYGEHWVEIYVTLPGSQTTLLVTLPLPLDPDLIRAEALH